MDALPADVVEACSRFRQGDVVASPVMVHMADLSRPLTPASEKAAKEALEDGETDLGVEPVDETVELGVIVSQTCDIRSDRRPLIKLAPLFPLKDPAGVTSPKRSADRQRRIDDVAKGRLVHRVMMDGPPGHWGADLERITNHEKTILLDRDAQPGFSTPEAYRDFAWRCGHVHDRPAVPDPVDRLLVAKLRDFLLQLRVDDPTLFRRLNAYLAEEALQLDDWDVPTNARLWFFSDQPLPDDVRECLESWHQSLDPISSVAVLPNAYSTFDEVPASEYRDLRVISYWYLSDEDDSGEAR